MLRTLAKYGYARDIGAGVYNVHSPIVPPCVRASSCSVSSYQYHAQLHQG